MFIDPTLTEFQTFRKIPRLTRNCVVTEKIDGTNAQINILNCSVPDFDQDVFEASCGVPLLYTYCGDLKVAIYAGSRSRWITPKQDNYGFANWVFQHGTELANLGPGRHYGEWWGQGIQRNYGLKEKRFSLFNVSKWSDRVARPACCHIVPVLYNGDFSTLVIGQVIDRLRVEGSQAAPGFMKPEGVVAYHIAGNMFFKKTLEGDEKPKGKQDE